MATFNPIILKHHVRDNGTVRLKILAIHKKQKKYLDTGLTLTLSDLGKHTIINKRTREKDFEYRIKTQSFKDAAEKICSRYRDVCNKLHDQLDALTIDELVEYLREPEVTEIDFIQFSREHIQKMEEEGRKGSAGNYVTALNALIRFNGSEKLNVQAINYEFLTRFEDYIIKNPAKTDASQIRAPSLYLGTIRTLHNAIKLKYNDEDRGIIRIPFSPFQKFKISKPPATEKRAISVEQLRAIAGLPYLETVNSSGFSRFNLAKDMFMLSFFLIGMNSTDLYNCGQAKKGSLTYNRQKTKGRRRDSALIEVWIPAEAQPLMAKYKDPTGKRAFRFYLDYANEASFNKAINKGLNLGLDEKEKKRKKKVNRKIIVARTPCVGELIGVPDLDFYSARHTWASIAINKAGVDKYTVHAALNHVDPAMRVTDIYIDKDWSLINNANRKVIDYCFKQENEKSPGNHSGA